MTSSPSSLSQAQPYADTNSIIVGNGSQLPSTHVSSGSIFVPSRSLVLNEVLCVPNIEHFSCDNECYF